MNLNICNNCGGDYEYRNGRWICRSCGSYRPEQISNEEATLLYTAFQKLRLAEFDEAEAEFDDIIRKYPENANAYWGRLMSKYGIKYEQDFDGRIIPTCYATSIESVISSSDYKKALQYADEESRAYYKRQAEYIERVRLEWVEKASREKPYDIFICYKESDLACGIERTEDSIAVQDLYIHLTNKGYRVFYSHESLRDKVGEKYEPHIFNALSTAKVMLVYGSRPEYITSTWLKNEWTRYEERLKNGEKKEGSLLVACDGFSPNELPRALSSMQCFNANDRSFYSDLDEAIERLLRKEEKAPVNVSSAPKPEQTPQQPAPKSKAPVIAAVILILAALAAVLAWAVSSKNAKCEHVIMTRSAEEPTCTKNGRTEEQYCAVCGEIFQAAESVPRLEHKSSGEATCTENSHCIFCGDILEYARGHHPGAEATCTESQYCSVCGTELNGAFGHTPGREATCTEPQYCTTCHEELEPAKGHSHQSNVTEPTCTERGYTTYTCECGDTYVENYVDALGHLRTSDATCTEDSFCDRCGELLKSANGHIPGTEATCTQAQYCLICNMELEPVRKHEYEAETVEPTCEEQGFTRYTCSGCGDTYKENYTGPLGHAPSGKESCTDESLCTRCGAMMEPAGAHTVSEWIVDRELTEEVSGIRHGFCDVCDKRIEKQYSYSQDLWYEELPDGTYEVHLYQCKDKIIIIPSAHEGKIVSAIAVNGFGYQSQIKKVIIPDSVSVIGETAFCNCENLESVTVGGSVTTIGNTAFYGCKKLTSLDIRSVGSIGESAFAYCSGLLEINVSGAREIGDFAFEGCGNLQTVSFPDTLTSIGQYAFKNCNALQTVVLPNGLTSLGVGAFTECNKLKSVTVGNLLTAIEDYTFSMCPDLTTVILGSGLKKIGAMSFYQCGRLTDCAIPASVTSIGNEAFSYCLSLKSAAISDNVTELGESAFYDCNALTTLVIGNGLTRVPNNAFGGCDGLMTVIIGDGVSYIGVGAFAECGDLTSVTIGKNVIQIGADAFHQCNKLVEVINLSAMNIKAGGSDYGYVAYNAKDVHGGQTKLKNDDGYLFYFCDGAWFLMGYIGDEQELALPASCNGSTYAVYQNSFIHKGEITSLTVSDGVTEIRYQGFMDCDGLTSVTIGDSVSRMEAYAFYNCSKLISVSYEGTVAQWSAIEMEPYVFYDTLVTKIVCSDGEVVLD